MDLQVGGLQAQSPSISRKILMLIRELFVAYYSISETCVLSTAQQTNLLPTWRNEYQYVAKASDS